MSPSSTRPRRSRAVTIPLFVAGGLSTVLAVAFLALGGISLWADGKKDDHGYITTDTETYAAGSAALVTDGLGLDIDNAESLVGLDDVGTVRLNVAPRDGKPVFVGIARSSDVEAYLDRVAHTTLTDVELDPFVQSTREHGGRRRAPRPADQPIWEASSTGSGIQELTWDIRDGDWSIVVMNADGSQGVHAAIDAGAKLDWLEPLGWSSLGGGAFLLLVAVGMIVVAVTPPRDRGGSAAAPATAAAPAVVAPTP